VTGAASRLASRLGHQDLELLARLSLPDIHPPAARRAWIGITHAGSAAVTIALALLVPLAWLPGHPGRWLPAAALAISHLAVQVLKRKVQRTRPPRVPVIPCPDRFSFPSGHATSSLSVALAIGLLAPPLAIPLAGLGVLVGWSRVVLGVHYPGDVLAGQAIAAATVVVLTL
jgi:undecaprenyl-diphosphatase